MRRARRHRRAFANGVEAWLKPTDFKNDQVLFTLNAPGGTSLAPPADYPGGVARDRARRLVRRRRPEGARPAESADRQDRVGASLHRPLDRTASRAAPRRPQLETALQLLYQEFTAPGDDAESFALLKKQLDGGGRQPRPSARPGLRREARAGEHVGSLHRAAADAGARRDARAATKMIAFYKAAVRQRRRLHVLHGRRVQGGRGDPAARAVRRLAAVDRPARRRTFKDVAIHFPDTTKQEQVEAGREPRGQTVISFFADPSIDPQEQEKIIAATTVLDIALRDILREDLGPDLHRQRRPVAVAAAARQRPHRGPLPARRRRTCRR